MNCSNCGTELEYNDRFCPECGQEQKNAVPAEAFVFKPASENPRIRHKKIIVALSLAMIILAGGFISIYAVRNNEINKQMDLGNKYLSEGNYDQAILAYNEAVNIDPKNVPARVGLARAYIESGDFEKATETIDIVQKSDSANAEQYKTLIAAYIKQQKYEEANDLRAIGKAKYGDDPAFMTAEEADLTTNFWFPDTDKSYVFTVTMNDKNTYQQTVNWVQDDRNHYTCTLSGTEGDIRKSQYGVYSDTIQLDALESIPKNELPNRGDVQLLGVGEYGEHCTMKYVKNDYLNCEVHSSFVGMEEIEIMGKKMLAAHIHIRWISYSSTYPNKQEDFWLVENLGKVRYTEFNERDGSASMDELIMVQ